MQGGKGRYKEVHRKLSGGTTGMSIYMTDVNRYVQIWGRWEEHTSAII